jgi:hypothetical protein
MLLLASCLLGVAWPAQADVPAPAVAATAAPMVHLEVLGTTDEAEQLSASLRELLRRISVELELVPTGAGLPDTGGASDLVVEVDLRDPGLARVRLGRPGAPLGEPRGIAQRHSRELLLEETALVVYAASESLLAEAPSSASYELESPPPPPPPPPPPVAPPPATAHPIAAPRRPVPAPRPPTARHREAAPWLAEGLAVVGARWYASGTGAATGLGLGARTHFGASPWLPALWLRGDFHLPFRASHESVELSTSVWSLRLEPTVELAGRGSFRLEAGVGAGFDVFVLAPVASAPAASGGDRRDVSPLLSALVAGSLTAGRSSRVVLAAMLDYDLAPRRYVIAQGGAHVGLLEPFRLRPGLALGILFELAGTERRP